MPAVRKPVAKKDPIKKRFKKLPFMKLGISVLVVALCLLGWLAWNNPAPSLTSAGPSSRQVILYQESIIKETKPAPTTAALQYAYVASAYADGLNAYKQAGALEAAKAALVMLYPTHTSSIDTEIAELASTNHIKLSGTVPAAIVSIDQTYKERYTHDGHDLPWDGIIPKGPGKWVQLTSKAPFTPRAGDWQRWNVKQTISVSPPPTYGSAEDLQQIDIVRQTVATRNGEDVNIINFWAGRPGSETPGGIWQNQLFVTIQKDLPHNALAADRKYALVQKTMAQAISDAFMECWKVKYTYWTARPDMRDHSLVTAMDDPNFPSYISGHSTISKAAADVLSVQIPKYRTQWEDMAMQARQSRLKAGIHFDIDNVVGFQVGTDVAQQTIAAQHLTAVFN